MIELELKEMYFAAGVKKITGPYVGAMRDTYEEALKDLREFLFDHNCKAGDYGEIKRRYVASEKE
ncbi:MAG: hypothetical protein FH756_02265 [Firmicutes bacterium]|nr:hypothetical protein [Bacillota bacterium]